MSIRSGNDNIFGNVVRNCAVVIGVVAMLWFAPTSQAQVTTCDMDGIGSASLVADVPGAEILGVSTGRQAVFRIVWSRFWYLRRSTFGSASQWRGRGINVCSRRVVVYIVVR